MRLLDLHLGQPVHRGALSVFPVWNGRAVSEAGYDLHAVTITERAGAPVVSELVATNLGARPSLVLAGELLEGGQQHRVAARTTMVEPGHSAVLEVRCVEQGRWSGAGGYRQRGRRAPASLRGVRDQGEVWQRIQRHEQRHGGAPTHSVLATLDAVQTRAGGLVAGLKPLPFQSGVLIGLAGAPMLLETFDVPETLAQVWDELLMAAAFDAVDAPVRPMEGWRAREFVSRVTSVPLQRRPDGAVRGAGEWGPVEGLVWNGRVVHAVAANARHELVGV